MRGSIRVSPTAIHEVITDEARRIINQAAAIAEGLSAALLCTQLPSMALRILGICRCEVREVNPLAGLRQLRSFDCHKSGI